MCAPSTGTKSKIMRLVSLFVLALVARLGAATSEFIVVLGDGVSTTGAQWLRDVEGIDSVVSVDAHKEKVLKVATTLTRKQLLAVEGVVAAEEDGEMYLDDPVTTMPVYDDEGSMSTMEATWGLDRIDGKVDNQFTPAPFDGKGVSIYILDTGVYAAHKDFTGRVTKGKAFIGGGEANTDCHGHGTHVASTAAGKDYGVATGATIVPVKVLACSGTGSTSGVIAGVNWVVAQPGKNKVISMSLGGGSSAALDAAINKAKAAGVIVSVAAGNSNADSCKYSPAGAAGAFTVGAMTSKDERSSFSNFGACTDVFAPGSAILAADPSSKRATRVRSGTSMACPYVSGVFATMRQKFPSDTVDTLYERLVLWSEKGALEDVGSKSPNQLLRNWASTPTLAPTSEPTNRPTKATKAPTPRPTPRTEAPTAPPKCETVDDFCACSSRHDCEWVKNKGCIGEPFCTFTSRSKCRRSPVCRWSGRDKKCSRIE